MGFVRVVIILSIFLVCSSTEAYNFIVGGKNGWSSHPSEDYKQWSGRMRFSVNDTLSFKYPKETDSVVVVSKDDYEKCNAANPILKLDGGDSTFKFDRSGPFYFITANKSNCDQGQKLLIVVLSIRNKSPPTTSSPPPASQAPVPSPESQAPVPSPESQAPGPSPSSESPAVSPAPETSVPAVSPAPVTSGPAANAPGTVTTPSPLSPGNTPADGSPATPGNSFAPAVSPAMVVSVVLSVTVAAIITFA